MHLPGLETLASTPLGLLQSGAAPDVLKVVAAWFKAVIGTAAAYKTYDELSGQGDVGEKLKRVWPYGAALAAVAMPDVLGKLFGVAQGTGLMDILSSWQFTMN